MTNHEHALKDFALSYRKVKPQDIPVYEQLDSATQSRLKSNDQKIKAYFLRYRSGDNEVGGFVVIPKAKIRGLIVFCRGGTKDFGLVLAMSLFGSIADMARRGYIIAGSQYTGNRVSQGKDEWGGMDLDAVKHLMPLAVKLADKHPVYLYGGSRGGMMALMLLRDKAIRPAAVALNSPATDLVQMSADRPEMQKVFKEAFGGKVVDKKARSPINWTDRLPNVPILIQHGTADWRVKVEQSLAFAQKLQASNQNYRLIIYPNGEHCLPNFREAHNREMITFFNDHAINR